MRRQGKLVPGERQHTRKACKQALSSAWEGRLPLTSARHFGLQYTATGMRFLKANYYSHKDTRFEPEAHKARVVMSLA